MSDSSPVPQPVIPPRLRLAGGLVALFLLWRVSRDDPDGSTPDEVPTRTTDAAVGR